MFDKDVALPKIQHLIGTPYAPSIKEQISDLTGYPRVVGPREPSTRERARNRIFIRVDEADVITGFTFA